MFRRLRRRLFRIALVSGAGAATAYFFDPDRGAGRRAQTRDKAQSFLRRKEAEADRKAQHEANVAVGQMVEARGGGVPHPVDDVEVVRAVEQVLATVDAETKDVTIEAVDHVVTLRGQLPSRDALRAVEEAAQTAPGVLEVQSFLHTPGTPAPNKAASLRAS
jgi:osmotically-inducible protein OsmY